MYGLVLQASLEISTSTRVVHLTISRQRQGDYEPILTEPKAK